MKTNGSGLRIINSSDDYWTTDVETAEIAIRRLVTVPLTENQFSALVSFIVTTGVTTFRRSKLLRLVNQRRNLDAAREMSLWTASADSDEDFYLVKRRSKERRLFLRFELVK